MNVRSVFQGRVEQALVRLEDTKGGAVHPLRAIPMDLVADAVARQLATSGVSPYDRWADDVAVGHGLAAIAGRYNGPPQFAALR